MSDIRSVSAPADYVATAAPIGSLVNRISWGGIFAGAVIAVAISFALNTLGAAVGASMIDPVGTSTPNASSFSIAGGIWLLISNLIGLAIGAYAASRVSGPVDTTTGMFAGAAVWATMTIFTVVIVGSLAGGAVATAGAGVANMVGSVASGVGSTVAAVGGAATAHVDPNNIKSQMDNLANRAQSALTASTSNPQQMTSDQRKAEIARLVGQRVTEGSLSDSEQNRLTQLVSAEAGMTPEEAQQKIQQVEDQAQQAIAKAKDTARQAAVVAVRTASIAGYLSFATLVLGLIVACVAGARGAPWVGDRSRLPAPHM